MIMLLRVIVLVSVIREDQEVSTLKAEPSEAEQMKMFLAGDGEERKRSRRRQDSNSSSDEEETKAQKATGVRRHDSDSDSGMVSIYYSSFIMHKITRAHIEQW
ncbi:hypothetical protein ANCCAN_11260 [Ancylostoma caninum]|uniref:Uncharacterized protein n=1 Tax=Ancylostoma caninum TaxID=29170 RepID=A0A368GIU9_ANCCA|nr:hypothetical protein ANCCAN_11260 [Ancylostoma caninum]